MNVLCRTYPVARVCTAKSREALPMECQVGHMVGGLVYLIYLITTNMLP